MPKLPTGSKLPTGMPRVSGLSKSLMNPSLVMGDQAIENMPVIEASGAADVDQSTMDQLQKNTDLEQKYGDNSIEAFAEGVGRGVVPGFDRIATAFGADPDRLREIKARNEFAAGTGEAAGLIGGAVASGGENIAADATVGGLAAGAEGVTKSFVEKLFANQAEKSLGRKIVEKSLEHAAGGAVAGAGLGLNTLLNENALGDADLTGENLLAYAGTGAVLNGLVGGAFGAGEALAPVAKGAVDDLTGQLKKTFGKELDIKRNVSELFGSSPATKQAIYEDIGHASDQELQNYFTDRMGLKTTDFSAEEVLRKHEATGKELGDELQTQYAKADAVADNKVIPTGEAHTKLLESVDNYVTSNPNEFDSTAAKNIVKRVKNEILNRLDRVGPNSFESANDFWDAIKTWGDKANRAFKNPEDSTLIANLYKNMNRAGRDYLDQSIERVTTGTPAEGVGNQIKSLNREFRLWYAIDQGANRKAVTDKALAGFKDSMAAIVGGAIGGGPGAVLATAAHKVLDSDLKRRFIILNTAERANVNGASKVADSLKSFFEGSAKASAAMAKAVPRMSLMNSGFAVGDKNQKPQNEQQAFKNVQNHLVDWTVNPDKLATKITYNTMKAGYAAPNATKFAQVTLAKAVQFLYDKMPKDSHAGMNMFPTDFKPSSLEMAKFQRYVQAVENPYSVLEDMKSGTLTREHIEALQTVYPAIYSQIQSQTLKYVQKHPELSYPKKVQLGTLLSIPTDSSMQPLTIAARQMSFQEQPQQGGAIKSTAKGVSGIKASERYSTESEKIATGAYRE